MSEKNKKFPGIKKSIQDFIDDEDGSITRSKLVTVGSMVLLMTIFAGQKLALLMVLIKVIHHIHQLLMSEIMEVTKVMNHILAILQVPIIQAILHPHIQITAHILITARILITVIMQVILLTLTHQLIQTHYILMRAMLHMVPMCPRYRVSKHLKVQKHMLRSLWLIK